MAKQQRKRPRAGRPSVYDSKMPGRVKRLCEMGATDIEIADLLGIEWRTLYRWKHLHPAFSQALIVGKATSDERVARSYYQRAVGYDYSTEQRQETREAQKLDEGKPTERIEMVTVKEVITTRNEHVPAETGAGFLWLKNRVPKEWSDKQDFGGTVTLQLTEQDLDA